MKWKWQTSPSKKPRASFLFGMVIGRSCGKRKRPFGTHSMRMSPARLIMEELIKAPSEPCPERKNFTSSVRLMRVLVVEDEKKTASFVKKALQSEGFAVDVAHNGDDGLALAQTTPYDTVVLDIMLPGRDGLSIVRQLREGRNAAPVLLLSARGAVDERIEGLNAGADDYLPKPFALGELVARVRALVRRGSGASRSVVLKLADLSVDTIQRDVKRAGKAIDLSAREYRLLEFLLRSQGRV